VRGARSGKDIVDSPDLFVRGARSGKDIVDSPDLSLQVGVSAASAQDSSAAGQGLVAGVAGDAFVLTVTVRDAPRVEEQVQVVALDLTGLTGGSLTLSMAGAKTGPLTQASTAILRPRSRRLPRSAPWTWSNRTSARALWTVDRALLRGSGQRRRGAAAAGLVAHAGTLTYASASPVDRVLVLRT
jgi:hypothetical protein